MLERILLIDDSDDDAALLKVALKRAGLAEPIFWIRDPEEAMAYLAGEREYADRDKFPVPNLLLLDLRMPKINGLEFLQWFKSQPHLNRMLVVVVTLLEDPKAINEAYQLGAHSYLNKAGSTEEFEGFVQFVTGLGRMTKPSPEELQKEGQNGSSQSNVA